MIRPGAPTYARFQRPSFGILLLVTQNMGALYKKLFIVSIDK